MKIGDLPAAYTSSNNNSELGVLCFKTCGLYFGQGSSTCDDDVTIPSLINSPSGSFSAVFRCRKIGTLHILFADFNDTFIDAMEIGGTIGIALPMRDGQFRVSRFSLTGALKASARALALAQAAGQADEGAELKDYTL